MTELSQVQLVADELGARVRGFYDDPERGFEFTKRAAALVLTRAVGGRFMYDATVAAAVDRDGGVDWFEITKLALSNPWSSGERALIRLAASLAGDFPDPSEIAYEPWPWSLDAMLLPLDEENTALVHRAFRLALYGPPKKPVAGPDSPLM